MEQQQPSDPYHLPLISQNPQPTQTDPDYNNKTPRAKNENQNSVISSIHMQGPGQTHQSKKLLGSSIMHDNNPNETQNKKGEYVISYNFDGNAHGITRNIFIGWDDQPTNKCTKKPQMNLRYNSLAGNQQAITRKDRNKSINNIYHNKQKNNPLNTKTPIRNCLLKSIQKNIEGDDKQNKTEQNCTQNQGGQQTERKRVCCNKTTHHKQGFKEKQNQCGSLVASRCQSNYKENHNTGLRTHYDCVKCNRKKQHSEYCQNTQNSGIRKDDKLKNIYNTNLSNKTYIPAIDKSLSTKNNKVVKNNSITKPNVGLSRDDHANSNNMAVPPQLITRPKISPLDRNSALPPVLPPSTKTNLSKNTGQNNINQNVQKRPINTSDPQNFQHSSEQQQQQKLKHTNNDIEQNNQAAKNQDFPKNSQRNDVPQNKCFDQNSVKQNSGSSLKNNNGYLKSRPIPIANPIQKTERVSTEGRQGNNNSNTKGDNNNRHNAQVKASITPKKQESTYSNGRTIQHNLNSSKHKPNQNKVSSPTKNQVNESNTIKNVNNNTKSPNKSNPVKLTNDANIRVNPNINSTNNTSDKIKQPTITKHKAPQDGLDHRIDKDLHKVDTNDNNSKRAVNKGNNNNTNQNYYRGKNDDDNDKHRGNNTNNSTFTRQLGEIEQNNEQSPPDGHSLDAGVENYGADTLKLIQQLEKMEEQHTPYNQPSHQTHPDNTHTNYKQNINTQNEDMDKSIKKSGLLEHTNSNGNNISINSLNINGNNINKSLQNSLQHRPKTKEQNSSNNTIPHHRSTDKSVDNSKNKGRLIVDANPSEQLQNMSSQKQQSIKNQNQMQKGKYQNNKKPLSPQQNIDIKQQNHDNIKSTGQQQNEKKQNQNHKQKSINSSAQGKIRSQRQAQGQIKQSGANTSINQAPNADPPKTNTNNRPVSIPKDNKSSAGTKGRTKYQQISTNTRTKMNNNKVNKAMELQISPNRSNGGRSQAKNKGIEKQFEFSIKQDKGSAKQDKQERQHTQMNQYSNNKNRQDAQNQQSRVNYPITLQQSPAIIDPNNSLHQMYSVITDSSNNSHVKNFNNNANENSDIQERREEDEQEKVELKQDQKVIAQGLNQQNQLSIYSGANRDVNNLGDSQCKKVQQKFQRKQEQKIINTQKNKQNQKSLRVKKEQKNQMVKKPDTNQSQSSKKSRTPQKQAKNKVSKNRHEQNKVRGNNIGSGQTNRSQNKSNKQVDTQGEKVNQSEDGIQNVIKPVKNTTNINQKQRPSTDALRLQKVSSTKLLKQQKKANNTIKSQKNKENQQRERKSNKKQQISVKNSKQQLKSGSSYKKSVQSQIQSVQKVKSPQTPKNIVQLPANQTLSDQFADTDSQLQINDGKSSKNSLRILKSQAPQQITCRSKRSMIKISNPSSMKNNNSNPRISNTSNPTQQNNKPQNQNLITNNPRPKNSPPKPIIIREFKNTACQSDHIQAHQQQEQYYHTNFNQFCDASVDTGDGLKNRISITDDINKPTKPQQTPPNHSPHPPQKLPNPNSIHSNRQSEHAQDNHLVSFGNITCLPQLQPVQKQSFLQIDNTDMLNRTDFPPLQPESEEIKDIKHRGLKQRRLNLGGLRGRGFSKCINDYDRAPILSYIYGQERKLIQRYQQNQALQRSSYRTPYNFCNSVTINSSSNIILKAIALVYSIDPWMLTSLFEPYLTEQSQTQVWLYCNGHWKSFLGSSEESCVQGDEFLSQIIQRAVKLQYKITADGIGIQEIVRMLTGLRVVQPRNKKKLIDQVQYHIKKGSIIKGISKKLNKPIYNVTAIQNTPKKQKLIQISLNNTRNSKKQQQCEQIDEQQNQQKDQNILWIKQQTFQKYFDYFLLICHRQQSYWTSKSLKISENPQQKNYSGQTLVYTLDSIKNAIGSLQLHTKQQLQCKIDFYRQIKPKILKFVGSVNEKNKPSRSIQCPNPSLYFNFSIRGRYYILLKLMTKQAKSSEAHISLQSSQKVQIRYLQTIQPDTLKNSTSQYIQIDNKTKNFHKKLTSSIHSKQGQLMGKSASRIKQDSMHSQSQLTHSIDKIKPKENIREQFISYLLGKHKLQN